MTFSFRMGLATLSLAAVASASHAADFDGSKQLICAPVEAMDCTSGEPCRRGLPAEIGAPKFLHIDFAKKVVLGTQRSSPIAAMETSATQLLLQGSELGYAWSIALDQESGQMTATLTDREGAFVLFGSCIPI